MGRSTKTAAATAVVGLPNRLRANALDPEAHALLRGLNLAMPRLLRQPSVRLMRRRWQVLAMMLGRRMPVAAVEDLTIAGPGGPLRLRLYRPHRSAPGQLLPALLWLHGGGFVIGDLGTADPVCRNLARTSGAVVVSVDYRLVPEHDLHAGRADARAALDWLAANAAALGIDSTRLAVGGDSAGGNLAAVLAQHVVAHGGPPLALQVLAYPATNLRDAVASTEQNAEGYLLTVQSMAWIDALIGPQVDRADPRISPALAPRLAGLPPVVMVSAGFDPIRDDGLAYATRLRAAGVPVQLLHYPGQFHGFVNFDASLRAARDALDRLGTALADAFAGTAPDRTCEIAVEAERLPANLFVDATIATLMAGERWEQWRNAFADRVLRPAAGRDAWSASPWLSPMTALRHGWAGTLAPIRARETYRAG
jgi:acetyl esterase